MKNELKYPPTPILILYLKYPSYFGIDDIDKLLENTVANLNYVSEHGWEFMIIPTSDMETHIEIAAVDNSFDVIEFDKLKEQILEKCGN